MVITLNHCGTHTQDAVFNRKVKRLQIPASPAQANIEQMLGLQFCMQVSQAYQQAELLRQSLKVCASHYRYHYIAILVVALALALLAVAVVTSCAIRSSGSATTMNQAQVPALLTSSSAPQITGISHRSTSKLFSPFCSLLSRLLLHFQGG